MDITEIVAQSVGMVAMLFNIFSYQCKKQRAVIAMQLLGAALFSVNYFLLGAMVGGLLNLIATIRAIVFLFKEKLKTNHIAWFIGFVSSYIAIYILNFTLFGKETTLFNLIIEILPVVGMTALNIGFRLKRAADVRRCALVSSPSWLIYNIVAGSWGAIACEVFTLFSIVIGMLRHDRKKQ